MNYLRLALPALFLAVVLLVGLDGELIRNEGLRARLAAEALADGNWLVPRLDGQPHLTKPPGMGVLIALCSAPFGAVSAVSARLPSVFAAAAVVVLFGWSVARCAGRNAGLLAAAVLPCCPLWLDRVPSAEIDLVQLAWVAGALLCLLRAVEWEEEAPGDPRRWPWWLAALACVAGGLFTKWTAPAFFYLTTLPWLGWRGRWRLLLSLPHLVGAAAVAVLGGLWLLHVGHSAGWETLADTLRREALLRLSPGHHPRPYPWSELLTFPLAFLAGSLPWTLLALPALRRCPLPGARAYRLWQLCQVWLWAALLFWTLAPGHRPRHILPAQPAVAGLAVLAALAWLQGEWHLFGGRIGAKPALTATLALWLGVKLLFVGVVVPVRVEQRQVRIAAEQLAARVPVGATLHLGRLKDDGLLFYYDQGRDRPLRRLLDRPEALGPGAWCLLTAAEWQTWPAAVPLTVQARLRDGQGDPLVLARRP